MSDCLRSPICLMGAINSAKDWAPHLHSELDALAGLHGTVMRDFINGRRPKEDKKHWSGELRRHTEMLASRCRAMSEKLAAEAETLALAEAPNASRNATTLRLLSTLLLSATDIMEHEILGVCEVWLLG